MEQEEAQEAVASEKDEPEIGVQTRRGPLFACRTVDSYRNTKSVFVFHR